MLQRKRKREKKHRLVANVIPFLLQKSLPTNYHISQISATEWTITFEKSKSIYIYTWQRRWIFFCLGNIPVIMTFEADYDALYLTRSSDYPGTTLFVFRRCDLKSVEPPVATTYRSPPLLSDQSSKIPKVSSQITIFGTSCKRPPLVSDCDHFYS